MCTTISRRSVSVVLQTKPNHPQRKSFSVSNIESAIQARGGWVWLARLLYIHYLAVHFSTFVMKPALPVEVTFVSPVAIQWVDRALKH